VGKLVPQESFAENQKHQRVAKSVFKVNINTVTNASVKCPTSVLFNLFCYGAPLKMF